MDELQLMQDYFWIIEQCKDPEEVFADKPAERQFASLWVLKLCNDIFKGAEAKRLRNTYLLEFSRCLDAGELSEMFMRLPPKGALPPFAGASNIKIDKGVVIHEMQAAAAEAVPVVSPRNYETHLRTKIFDDNRGGCAYLAVSLADPKQGPIWLQMGSSKPFPLDKMGEQDKCKKGEGDVAMCPTGNKDVKVNVSFGEFCLDAISKELSGQALPHECPELEETLEKYAAFIKNYPIGEEAKKWCGSKLRTFLLVNLQTDLVQALLNT